MEEKSLAFNDFPLKEKIIFYGSLFFLIFTPAVIIGAGLEQLYSQNIRIYVNRFAFVWSLFAFLPCLLIKHFSKYVDLKAKKYARLQKIKNIWRIIPAAHTILYFIIPFIVLFIAIIYGKATEVTPNNIEVFFKGTFTYFPFLFVFLPFLALFFTECVLIIYDIIKGRISEKKFNVQDYSEEYEFPYDKVLTDDEEKKLSSYIEAINDVRENYFFAIIGFLIILLFPFKSLFLLFINISDVSLIAIEESFFDALWMEFFILMCYSISYIFYLRKKKNVLYDIHSNYVFLNGIMFMFAYWYFIDFFDYHIGFHSEDFYYLFFGIFVCFLCFNMLSVYRQITHRLDEYNEWNNV